MVFKKGGCSTHADYDKQIYNICINMVQLVTIITYIYILVSIKEVRQNSHIQVIKKYL